MAMVLGARECNCVIPVDEDPDLFDAPLDLHRGQDATPDHSSETRVMGHETVHPVGHDAAGSPRWYEDIMARKIHSGVALQVDEAQGQPIGARSAIGDQANLEDAMGAGLAPRSPVDRRRADPLSAMTRRHG